MKEKFNGEKITNKKGNGLEGLTFFKEIDNEKLFFVSNQSNDFEGDDKSSIFIINEEGEVKDYFPQKIKDIADLYF